MASGPITSWQIRGKSGNSGKSYFIGSKITADSDCSHKIKKYFLLGRKTMTNLYSILKSKDITLSTKVQIVKTMVFLVVMYGYDSWTIKKLMLSNWVLGKTFESPLDSKEIKPVNPKGNQSRIFNGSTDAKTPVLWVSDKKSQLIGQDPEAGKDWR